MRKVNREAPFPFCILSIVVRRLTVAPPSTSGRVRGWNGRDAAGLIVRARAGQYDQRVVEARPDVLVFTSDVLTEHTAVTGQMFVHLFVSSTANDTDFTVRRAHCTTL